MTIALKRAYEPPTAADGYRVLVERLWPRGLSKAQAKVDLWAKEAAPSTALRIWFGHDPKKWQEFKRRYAAELQQQADILDAIAARARAGRVTFVFASREERFNNAVALKDFLTPT